MLTIETTIVDDQTEILTLHGHVMATNVTKLDAACQQALNQAHYYLLLEMSDCDYISSSAISLLLQVATQCRRWNRGDLVLIRPTEFVQNVLRLANLLSEERSHFATYSDLPQALADLKHRRSG